MRPPVDWPTRDVLSHRVTATPSATALVDAATGETWSYRELDVDVAETAGRLAAAGVESGDHVGVLMKTRPSFVRVAHAVWRLGCVLVPLNVRRSETTLRSQSDHVGLTAVVCEAETEALARDTCPAPRLSVDVCHEEGVRTLASFDSEHVERAAWNPDDAACVMFTSGTTGDPKGVVLTLGNFVESAAASAFRLGVAADDRWLCCLPMYHMGGLAPVVRSALYGTAVVVQRGFDPEATGRVLNETSVTCVSMVPTMLRRTLDAGWTPTDSFRFVLLGGAPTPDELVRRCERQGVPVCPTYGMTETTSQVATARPTDAFDAVGTVGAPLVCTEVTVVDGDGDPLPPGDPGELVVDGPTVTAGYFENDAATEAAFGEYGFHTGDVGHRDDEGRLWVVGRVDDAIITGGENVYPQRVADALVEHGAVGDAAVVGIPDEEWGERVVALVVATDDVSAGDLTAHCRSRLAEYEVPKSVVFTDEVPRTASGTVDRAAVRDAVREPER